MVKRRWAIGVEYDGQSFCGWQSQPDSPTVQDTLEAALSRIACEEIVTTCAGRTDSGVHATGQVAHFDCDSDRPDTAWVRGVNRYLPKTVRVCWARPVDEAFHARLSAVRRRYRYVLYSSPVRPALDSGRVGWIHRELDEGAIRSAIEQIIGRHDFSAFRSSDCQAKSPVKTLYRVDLARKSNLWLFDFEGSGFLHHMVRNLMGAFVIIGQQAQPPEWMGQLLAGRDRTKAAPTFSPAGLYLTGVTYPDSWPLPKPSSLPFD